MEFKQNEEQVRKFFQEVAATFERTIKQQHDIADQGFPQIRDEFSSSIASLSQKVSATFAEHRQAIESVAHRVHV